MIRVCSFSIDTDRWVWLIEWHMQRCINYHTTRCGEHCFIWFYE